MKLMKTLVVLATAVLLMTVAVAQRGGGRQGGMRFMAGFGDSSGVMLLQRTDVQKDIALTDEQKTKLEAVRQKMMEDMRAQRQNGGGGGFDRAAMQQMFKEMMDKTKVEAAKILTKEQMSRLREINIQLAGNSAILWTDVQTDLKLTTDQVAKVKDLNAKQQSANKSIGDKVQNGEISFEEMGEIYQKNQDTLNAELGKILKSDQKEKLKAMGGKPFKADDNG